jgi:TPR repeat protein
MLRIPLKSLMSRATFILTFAFLFSGCANQNIDLGVNAYNKGDFDLAASYWNPIAKKGNPVAQYNLGLLWEQGLGRTPKNKTEAANWFLLSARQGYVPAMVSLGKIQKEYGLNDAAISWLNLAARWGSIDAIKELKSWGKPVPPADLLATQQYHDAIKGQEAADAWGDAAYEFGRAIGIIGGGALLK